MSKVFTKSAAASAFSRFVSALCAIAVGMCFGGVLFYVTELPFIVKGLVILAISISLWIAFKRIRDAIGHLRSGQPWRVEITEQTLSWQAPSQDTMQSFELQLQDMKAVRSVCYINANEKNATTHNYFIELINGRIIGIGQKTSAIAPMKVFKALAEMGIPFRQDEEIIGFKSKTITQNALA